MPLPLPEETRGAVDVIALLANERLDSPSDLDAILGRWTFTGVRTHDDAELDAVRTVVAELIALWDAPRDDAADRANVILAREQAWPQLVRHDEFDWHVHAVAPDRPLATRIAVEAAMAFVDLIRLDQTDRCKRCADDGCSRLFFDLSRNRSRRFCSTTCQSRVNVAAFRARARPA